MMTATEQIEARKQAEEKPADPLTPPTPKPEAGAAKPASTSAASSPTRDPNSVTLTLEPHVYAHFAEKAKADDRTISKYIARHLRTFVDEIKSGGKF